MRVGIVSDVHGNLPALRSALGVLRSRGVDRLACPGDLVGYGPMPNECVEVLAEAGAVCVAGNHDLIALGRLPAARCVEVARRTLEWTAERLTPQSRDFLSALPVSTAIGERLVLAHGSLDDPEAYTRTAQAAGQAAALEQRHPQARVLVLGHTHTPAAWDGDGRPVAFSLDRPLGLPAPRCVLNAGAVGQTRTRFVREPRVLARCMLLDLERGEATWLAMPYAAAETRRALRAAGLPPRTYRLATPLRRAVRQRAAALVRR